MKKILIIGAGFLQSFLIKKSKDMGYHTIAIDKNPKSIGFQFADEYEVIDIVDQEACLKYALSKNIDGVMTGATDYGVLTSAYIAKKMSLPGVDYDVASIIKNKYMVRRMLFEHNVDDVAQHYEISDTDVLDEITTINFPVMVKPCDGSGSKAAIRVDSIQELKDACEKAINASLQGKALVEDFIEGKEYGVESFVYNGKIHVLGVLGKYMTNPPNYAELGHCIPGELSSEKKIREVAVGAIEALGINFGAVNMDVLVTEDRRVCVIDVGARMGGNLIGSHIIPISTDIDYMDNLIRSAVGDLVDLKPQCVSTNVVTRLLALKPGKVIKLPDFEKITEECQVEIYHQLQLGSEISEYRNNLDGFGYVVSQSNDVEKAVRQAEKAVRLIDEGVEREDNIDVLSLNGRE